jgi:Flp pilus assembly protein TadG
MNIVNSKLLHLIRRREGSAILETAFLMPLMIAMILGTVDFGRAYYMAIEVASAAHAGALYGTQNPTDTAGMVSAADLDAPDVSTLTPVATYGCECSDGSSAVALCTSTPSCTYNYVNYVSVTTTATYTTLIPYPGVPKSLALTSTALMRVGGD